VQPSKFRLSHCHAKYKVCEKNGMKTKINLFPGPTLRLLKSVKNNAQITKYTTELFLPVHKSGTKMSILTSLLHKTQEKC
jgi:hypothetical protein